MGLNDQPVYESAMKLIQFYLITEHVIWHSNLKHIKWCLNYLFCAWVTGLGSLESGFLSMLVSGGPIF